MHILKPFLTLLLVVIITVSCQKTTDINPNEVKFLISLSGLAEVPANASAATGTFDAVYNKSTKILKFKINHQNIAPTAWHIHKGASNATGVVIYSLGTTYTNGFEGQTVAFTVEQETDLLAGSYYVNIHSALFASGEIRGQLLRIP
jgi:hypothetical protein